MRDRAAAGEASAREGEDPFRTRLARALGARPGRAIRAEPGARRAAVVVALRAPAGGAPAAADGRGVEVLFVRRADFPRDPWAGHVALPGGRAAPGDADLVETARREMREETSLELARGQILGRLDEIRPLSPHLPPVIVTPFVAWLEPPASIREGPELAGHFWLPLEALPDPGHRTIWRRAGPPERIYPAIAHAGAVIWGLTFRVVEDFLERLRA